MDNQVRQLQSITDPLRVESRASLRRVKRIVIKVGSELLATGGNSVFQNLSNQIAELKLREIEIVIATSGAVALGLEPLGMRKRPVTSVSKQAAAAIGQCLVMSRWLTALSDYGVIVGQALLTHSDLKDRVSYLNIRDTLSYLLENGVVPIVNENDTVSIQRSRLGNNDRLAAELSGLIFSPLLIFLTQTNGIYTSDPAIDPKAERISSLLDTTDLGRSQSEGISQFGTGGVKTKIEAIQIAQEHGVASVVACGYDPQVLLSIIEGKDIGTFVGASSKPSIGARKRWISATLRPSGSVIIDRGAARALRLGSSLLHAGIRKVMGEFQAGDAVEVFSEDDKQVIARGVATLGFHDASRVSGRKSGEARRILGMPIPDEFIHRDNLVLRVDSYAR